MSGLIVPLHPRNLRLVPAPSPGQCRQLARSLLSQPQSSLLHCSCKLSLSAPTLYLCEQIAYFNTCQLSLSAPTFYDGGWRVSRQSNANEMFWKKIATLLSHLDHKSIKIQWTVHPYSFFSSPFWYLILGSSNTSEVEITSPEKPLRIKSEIPSLFTITRKL